MLNNSNLIQQLRKQYNDVEHAKMLNTNLATGANAASEKIKGIVNDYKKQRKEIVENRIVSKLFALPKCPTVLMSTSANPNSVIADSTLEKYQNQKNAFLKQCVSFDKLMLEDSNDYETDVAKLNECFCNEKEKISQHYKAYLADTLKEFNDVTNSINNNKLVNEKYYDLLPRIIEILEDGRAERLADALNLAITEKRDIDYKEQQLSLERQRLAEAERQTELAEIQEEREAEKERRWRRW